MKKLFFAIALSVISVTSVLNAQDSHERGNGGKNGKGHNDHGNGNGYGHKKDRAIGAPIDGGLLIALGAAGVAYFTLRKKKENS